MSTRSLLALAIFSFVFGCTGPRGSAGRDGTDGTIGPVGPMGPAGPLTDPPRIFSISPDSGSWKNVVTITGENFSATAANDEVYFDGAPATVLSATTTALIVNPSVLPVDASHVVDVSVIVAQQASNAFAWEVLPSGTYVEQKTAVLSNIRAVAPSPDSTKLYIADAGSGVIAVDAATGESTLVRANGADPVSAVAASPIDGEVFAAERVFLGGAMRGRYVAIDPNTGARRTVVEADFTIDPVHAMAVDANGVLYAMHVNEGIYQTTIYALLPNGNFLQGWVSLPALAMGSGMALLGGNLYVATANGRLFSMDISLGYGATANEITLTPAQSWLGGLAADPQTNQLRAIGNGGVLGIDLAGHVSAFATPVAPPENLCADWWQCTNDLAWTSDGTLWFGKNGDLMKIASGALGEHVAGVGNGVGSAPVSIGDDVFWTEFCNDTAVQRPLMRLAADGHTSVVARGFCALSLAATADQTLLVPDYPRNQLFEVDPKTGSKTILFDVSNGLSHPIAAGAAGGVAYVVHGDGTAVARFDATSGFNASWGTEPLYPQNLAVWNGRVITNRGRSILESAGGMSDWFVTDYFASNRLNVFVGATTLEMVTGSGIFDIDANGNAFSLATAPAGGAFLNGTMLPDHSYQSTLFKEDGTYRVVRVIP